MHFTTKLGEQQLRKEQAAGTAASWLFEREVSLLSEYVTGFWGVHQNWQEISIVLQRKKEIFLGQQLRKQLAAAAAVVRLFKREALQNQLYFLGDSKNVSVS